MTYNPNKKITIEIQQHVSPTLGYSLWDVSKKDKSRNIQRDAHEGDIKEILSDEQYTKFRSGQYKFIVTADSLCNQFSYLY
jgi:hypothetical protein